MGKGWERLVVAALVVGFFLPAAWAHKVVPGSLVDGVREDPEGELKGSVPSGAFNGVWRQWWINPAHGGRMMYTESGDGPATGWAKSYSCFGPSRNPERFDGQQAGDVSILLLNDLYVVYYSGRPLPGSPFPHQIALGNAWSLDGPDKFYRELQHPLLKAHTRVGKFGPNVEHGRTYGIGRPSAIWLDAWVYLFFNDTTAPASNPRTGGGIYCIRSRDAFFKHEVQELTREGFVDRESILDLTRDYSVADTNWADFQYIESKRQFVMLHHRQPALASLRFFDIDLNYLPEHDLHIPVREWVDEARFIRGPSGWSIPHKGDGASVVRLLWNYASPISTDPDDPPQIRYAGVDIKLD